MKAIIFLLLFAGSACAQFTGPADTMVHFTRSEVVTIAGRVQGMQGKLRIADSLIAMYAIQLDELQRLSNNRASLVSIQSKQLGLYSQNDSLQQVVIHDLKNKSIFSLPVVSGFLICAALGLLGGLLLGRSR